MYQNISKLKHRQKISVTGDRMSVSCLHTPILPRWDAILHMKACLSYLGHPSHGKGLSSQEVKLTVLGRLWSLGSSVPEHLSYFSLLLICDWPHTRHLPPSDQRASLGLSFAEGNVLAGQSDSRKWYNPVSYGGYWAQNTWLSLFF